MEPDNSNGSDGPAEGSASQEQGQGKQGAGPAARRRTARTTASRLSAALAAATRGAAIRSRPALRATVARSRSVAHGAAAGGIVVAAALGRALRAGIRRTGRGVRTTVIGIGRASLATAVGIGRASLATALGIGRAGLAIAIAISRATRATARGIAQATRTTILAIGRTLRAVAVGTGRAVRATVIGIGRAVRAIPLAVVAVVTALARGARATATHTAAAVTGTGRGVAAQTGTMLRASARRAVLRRAAVRWVATRGTDAVAEVGRQPAKLRAAARNRAHRKAAARVVSRQETAVRTAAAREAAQRAADLRRAEERRAVAKRTAARLVARERARRVRRRRILVTAAAALMIAGLSFAVGAYYVDTIPTPAELELPESTTIYYADGVTTMAKLGTENRTILPVADMNDAVKQAIIAAEDRSFWTHGGVDFSSVMRAAWNNVTGGQTQGASSITQQYARIAADLKGVTYARKAREAVLAWKIDDNYSKEQVLEFYLNTVPFGRGAYGIEAAAQAFFGKTAKRDAPPEEQVTVAEAMVLASLVKQPEPDPVDPEGSPGYDPARGGTAAANSISRWEYVREGMVALGYLTRTEANGLEYPHTVRALHEAFSQDRLDLPTGLVVNHVLSELRQREPFEGAASDHIRNGGYRIVTTIDKRAQDAAEAAADIRRATAPTPVRGQPANWQAALVAVEPGTGRVLAYYGGSNGTGADHAGWFLDDEGNPRGFGQHPPGSSFKVYDLAEALRQQVSLWSKWQSPAVKEFPASGRTRDTKAGPVRNSTSAKCQPNCTLWEATVASLNVTFFDLTERLGPANVIDMASRAGIDSMWTDRAGEQDPVRVDLRTKTGKELMAVSSGSSTGLFTTEVGIGQYGVTVLDHANGMATFAAGGKRAQAHFVREVTRRGERVYAESLTQANIGLTEEQVDELTWTLSQVPSAKLSNAWDAAGKTGTWQDASSTTRNAHTWMVGYTRSLATAVWLGTTDGKALITADGKTDVFGSTHPAAIWRQFMTEATAALALDPKNRTFRKPKLAPSAAPPQPAPSASRN